MNLAINSIQKNQISSRRQAARVFKVSRRTIGRRIKGIQPQRGSRSNTRLLHPIEEEELIKWIESIERRGFPAFLVDIKRIAQALLDRRGLDASRLRKIGKN